MATSVSAADKPAADKRLDQPVTIQHTSGRLHSAIEKLSKLTGVRLTCGRDKDDWQIRDIPVIVCAKDIPLGKLLRAIADTTHLALTSHKIENGISYRIWRTPALARELAEYEQKRRDWEVATTAWEWDALSKLKDVPESVFAVDPRVDTIRDRMDRCHVKEASPLLAAIGTEVRDSIMSGGPLRLSTQDAPENLKPLVDTYLRSIDSSVRRIAGDMKRRTATDDDFQGSAVIIECLRSAEGEKPSISIRVEGPLHYLPTVFVDGVQDSAMRAKGYLPKQPEEPKNMPRVPDRNLMSPAWNQSVTFKIPEDKDPLTFGDMCAALAESSGYAVVAEDYHSHQSRLNMKDAREMFEAGAPLRNISAFNHNQHWTLDDKNKILLSYDRSWTISHKALAPEWLIEGLRQKLNADGVEFDDVTPLANLTGRQLDEWVNRYPELTKLPWPFMGSDKGLWAFYNNLSSREKELARSDHGLRLNQSAVIALASIFKERDEKGGGFGVFLPANEKWWEKTTTPGQIADPILRLKSTETKGSGNRSIRHYSLEFSGRLESGAFTASVHFSPARYDGFPVYSDKREAELAKGK